VKSKALLIWGAVALVIAPFFTIPVLMLVAVVWLCVYLSKSPQRDAANINHLANEGRHWL